MGCCGGEQIHDDKVTEYQPDFKGPVKNRSCTDILCLAVFLVMVAGWIVVASFAYKYGDIDRIFNPTDTKGQICGRGNVSDKPYLFFFDLTKCADPSVLVYGCRTPQVCVANCPNYTFTSANYLLGDFAALSPTEKFDKNKLICDYHVTGEMINSESIKQLVEENKCAGTYYPTKSVAGRCLPAFINKVGNEVMNPQDTGGATANPDGTQQPRNVLADAKRILQEFWRGTKSTGEQLVQDFMQTWWMMLIGLLIAMGISFIWIVLLRYLGGIMVWLSIVAMLLLFATGCGYSFYMWNYLEEEEAVAVANNKYSGDITSRRQTWLFVGIISTIFLVITLLVLIFLRGRIRIAIALVNESSKAVGNMMCTLVFPLVPFALQLGVFVFWISITLFIASTGVPSYVAHVPNNCTCNLGTRDGDFCDPGNFVCPAGPKCGGASCNFYEYTKDRKLLYAQIYNVIAFIWALFFIDALSEMVLAGAFSTWYWTRDKSHMPALPLTRSCGRTFRYHVGSLALGSAIITVVRLIRYTIEYLHKKSKEYADNTCGKILFCCCRCCFWCLEVCLKFINKNAYIMISVHGKNFCSSARKAFGLLFRNILRTAVLDNVTSYLFFIGKLVVVGSTGIISYLVFSGNLKGVDVPPLNYYLAPVLVVLIGSYMVAAAFFGVYEMAVDTLFLCFLEDCERNDGSVERPYFMPKDLMKILGKRNKRDKSE